MAEPQMDATRTERRNSPLLWILVLGALVVVILWAIGAFTANEAVSDDLAEPMGTIERVVPGSAVLT